MIYKKIVLQGDQKLFFTSDLHAYHKNICRGTTTWDLKESEIHTSTRDFDTVEEMNRALFSGINDNVRKDDYLIFLGDWSFGGIENIWNTRKEILCENIIFILGNHDHHIANNTELPNWTDESDRRQYGHQAFGLQVYPYLELTVSSPKNGKNTYNLCHFPLSIWNKAHHGRIHLHGHCHASFQGEGRILDVGVDNAKKLLGEYVPFEESWVLDYMKDKKFVRKSHHNENTN